MIWFKVFFDQKVRFAQDFHKSILKFEMICSFKISKHYFPAILWFWNPPARKSLLKTIIVTKQVIVVSLDFIAKDNSSDGHKTAITGNDFRVMTSGI